MTSKTRTGWQVRGWRDGDEQRLRRIGELAFGETATADSWSDEMSCLERDRMIFAADPSDRVDRDDAVGVAGAFSYEISVPGGRTVPAAGVSWVGVLPTHRRRGILRALMEAQLDDVAARREPLAVLWCSEATIYGRFGYGWATSDARITVDRHRAGISSVLLSGGPPLQAELVDPVESLAAVEAVYEAVRRSRPGMLRRSEVWQRRAIADHEADRAGAGARRAVLFREAGGTVRAAARYRVGAWNPGAEDSRRTVVTELYADSPHAWAAAWSWLGELDLVGGYRAETRPVDDPVLLQLADLRAAKVETGDALWVRLVDLPGALLARGYAATADVVVEVTDDVLPVNAGRWRVLTSPAGATATRTDDAADLSLDTAVLAQSYLGLAGSLVRSRHAGRVTEHREGAVAELSRAFDSDLAPWCPVHF